MMKKFQTYWLMFNSALLVGVIVFVVLTFREQPKVGYIVNQKVFEGFEGKKELEEKLNGLKQRHKLLLDSLYEQVVQSGNNQEAVGGLREMSEKFMEEESELSARYTDRVWTQINGFVKVYGDEHGYAIIMGANGDGSLMYGQQAIDLSDKVIGFINRKYQGE